MSISKKAIIIVVTLAVNASIFADNTFIVRNELRDAANHVADSYKLSPVETKQACIMAVEELTIEQYPELHGLAEALCTYTHAEPGRPQFHRKDIISPIEEILYETSFYIKRLDEQ